MSKLSLLDLGGGYWDGVPAISLQDNQFPEMRNWITFGPKLKRRRGVTRLTTNPGATNLTSVFALKENTGQWTVVVGMQTGLGRLDGDSIIPHYGTPAASSNDGWVFIQYLGMGYALRPGTGLQRFGRDYYEPAGIPAPTVAPVIADGGTGIVEAGDYFTRYTYANSDTGAESNPSPPSIKLVHAASKTIEWTVTNSYTRQANCKKLYRVLPNQKGEYFWIATIPDNFTTGYSDNWTIDSFGPPVSFDNGLPPGGLKVGTLWNARLVATDGRLVYLSEAEMPESWAEDSIVEVYEDDGHFIKALVPLGDRCIVGKTNMTHGLVQTGPRTFERFTISDRHGLWSHWSCKVAEGRMIGYGGDNFYMCDGLSMRSISTKQIRKLLDKVPDSRKEFVTAEVYEEDSLYIASLPQSDTGSDNNRVMVVYNYKDGIWMVWDQNAQDTPSQLGSVFDADYGKHIYATYYSGHLYEFLSGNVDQRAGAEGPIKAILKTKLISAQNGLAHALQRLWVSATNLNRTLTIQVFRDGKTSPSQSRSVSLSGDGWKLYHLNNLGDPGQTVQVGLEYTGLDELELDGLALELINVFRPLRAK